MEIKYLILLLNVPFIQSYKTLNEKLGELFLTSEKVVVKNGYPSESHQVTTPDGYVLGVQRIPCGRHGDVLCSRNTSRPAILLLPGYTLSNYFFIIQPNKSLGYGLADAGYDVWIANLRGQSFSENQYFSATLGPAGWRFTLDEISDYDVPSLIDYVRNVTGLAKITLVGHSLGTVAVWATLSWHPEYNDKVELFFAMGPAVYVAPHTGPAKIFTYFPGKTGQAVLYLYAVLFAFQKVIPSGLSIRLLGFVFCDAFLIQKQYCRFLSEIIMGFDKNISTKIIPRLVNHISSMAILIFVQAMQYTTSGRFARLDVGVAGNQKRYGTDQSPLYNLTLVTVPTVIMNAPNDAFSSKENVEYLVRNLPNVVENYWVPDPDFQHLSFVIASDDKEKVNKKIYQILAKRVPSELNKE